MVSASNLVRSLRERIACGSHPAGVSILEVLFAIMITSIGLMGVIAIFPAAMLQAKRGMQADAVSIAGLKNIHTFDAEGMRQPARWLQYSGGYSIVGVPDGTRAFCIDPRFCAVNQHASANNVPYGTTPSVLQRVNLWNGTPYTPPARPPAMQQLQADLVFGIEDDLAYDRFRDGLGQRDNTLPAAAQFARDGSNNALKRESQGHLSWMATVSPKLERLETAITSGGNTIPTPEDRFVLSTVIFYDRPPDLRANVGLLASEWALQVTFPSGSNPCSEVRLTEPNSDPNLPSAAADRLNERVRRLNIRRDQWIMLLSYTQIQTRIAPLCRWYRVIDADEVDDTNYTVDLTLSGADWESTGGSPVFAVVFQGGVAVFEKTIKLEPRS